MKHERTEDDHYPPYKQQKISGFFATLTKEQGVQQATKLLLQSADTREELVEKQEAKDRVRKASCRVANKHSQQECRARKKEREIQSGVRGSDGKVKKVLKSRAFYENVEHADL